MVEKYLKTGRENAIHGETLARLCGMTARHMRNEIAARRAEGVAICADDGGYYIAADEAEKKAFLRRYLSGAYAKIKTARSLTRNEKDGAQMSIEDLMT